MNPFLSRPFISPRPTSPPSFRTSVYPTIHPYQPPQQFFSNNPRHFGPFYVKARPPFHGYNPNR